MIKITYALWKGTQERNHAESKSVEGIEWKESRESEAEKWCKSIKGIDQDESNLEDKARPKARTHH